MKTKTISVRLSEKQYKDLCIYSKENNKKQSRIIRKGLISILNSKKRGMI